MKEMGRRMMERRMSQERRARDLQEIGALSNAPKNAPACRTATTFDETASLFFWFFTPFSIRPNDSRKYGALTTPPPIPLLTKGVHEYHEGRFSNGMTHVS